MAGVMQDKGPFEFVAASYLVRICPARASTLREMAAHLRSCSDASIFYHTFQSLESHHYSAFSSDFAQWILAACNQAALAERMASLDLREFVSLEELRDTLAGQIEEHLRQDPAAGDRPAFEPFHYCEAMELFVPAGRLAHNLGDLAEGIRDLGLQSLHYHFITSRLRLRLKTNDFSNWVERNLELLQLAKKLNRIDFYTNTLEGVRAEILEALAAENPS
ncbi:MAG: DUF5752 family protein [Candidatus Acidiferrales bacterium]